MKTFLKKYWFDIVILVLFGIMLFLVFTVRPAEAEENVWIADESLGEGGARVEEIKFLYYDDNSKQLFVQTVEGNKGNFGQGYMYSPVEEQPGDGYLIYEPGDNWIIADDDFTLSASQPDNVHIGCDLHIAGNIYSEQIQGIEADIKILYSLLIFLTIVLVVQAVRRGKNEKIF